ncbi:MAG: HupE / UreJ protein, partial [Cytophagales bacterium CG18_big_fil_WC_8_21_14_2_50_42_9]
FCGIYSLQNWKRVLWSVTAFTMGHSLTLALSVFDQIRVSTALVEFLIPVTILITALFNIINKKPKPSAAKVSYSMALFFGLIHGMGFSNYLKSLLGRSSNIMLELFSFNLGLEAGQLVIVLVVLFLSWLIVSWFKVQQREWNLFLSSAIFGIAFTMALERLPF